MTDQQLSVMKKPMEDEAEHLGRGSPKMAAPSGATALSDFGVVCEP
jgi:hypothetical protein